MPIPVIVVSVPAIIGGVVAGTVSLAGGMALASWISGDFDVASQTHLGQTVGTRAWMVAVLEQTAAAKAWSADELAGMVAQVDEFLGFLEKNLPEDIVADEEDIVAIGDAIGAWALAGAAEVGAMIKSAAGGVVVSMQELDEATSVAGVLAGTTAGTVEDITKLAGAPKAAIDAANQMSMGTKVLIGAGVGLGLLLALRVAR